MENLFLIAGLGNPGQEYEQTRHNAGFMVVELLAKRWKAGWREEKRFQSRLARGDSGANRVVLCQPQTYMNASGEAVEAVRAFYKLPVSRVLIVSDDADLPLGEVRMRPGGGPGGHHGLESVECHLGTRDYARLRLGIGRTMTGGVREITNHVLGGFSRLEVTTWQAVLDRAAAQANCWVDAGIDRAMNQFNGAVTAPKTKDIE